MNKLTLEARGKINLAIDVTGKRENGYHDVEMILQEDKRTAILHTIAQIEASGGIQNETQGQSLLTELMKGLGL